MCIDKTPKLSIYLTIILVCFMSCSWSNSAYGNTGDLKSSKTYTNHDYVAQLYLREFEIRSYQAYRDEESGIAIWALKNYSNILINFPQEHLSNLQIRDIDTELMLTYARLAKVHKRIQDVSNYDINIQKSIDFAQKLNLEGKDDFDEEYIMNLVWRIDNVSNKCKD